MIIKIGIVAGEIWHYLEKEGRASLPNLTSSIEEDEKVIIMGLGWLAREGHVVLERKEEGYEAYLRKPSSE